MEQEGADGEQGATPRRPSGQVSTIHFILGSLQVRRFESVRYPTETSGWTFSLGEGSCDGESVAAALKSDVFGFVETGREIHITNCVCFSLLFHVSFVERGCTRVQRKNREREPKAETYGYTERECVCESVCV